MILWYALMSALVVNVAKQVHVNHHFFFFLFSNHSLYPVLRMQHILFHVNFMLLLHCRYEVLRRRTIEWMIMLLLSIIYFKHYKNKRIIRMECKCLFIYSIKKMPRQRKTNGTSYHRLLLAHRLNFSYLIQLT